MGRLRHKSALIGLAGLAVLGIFLVPGARSQSAPVQPPEIASELPNGGTFRTTAPLVNLLVTVKNAAGDLIGELEREHFRVFDQGVQQDVAIFEHQTAQPLSVALLVDTSLSAKKDLRLTTQSAARFLNLLVREGNTEDAAELYSFSYQVTLLNAFTRRVARLEDNLQKLEADSGTSLYDAVYFSARDFGNRQGRHVLIAITDGTDTTSKKKYREAVEAAQRADAVVYPIILVPVSASAGRNTGGEHALETIAQSTGGKTFYATVGAQLDQTFSEILRELRTQYLIGYYPRGVTSSRNGFHLVRIEIPGKKDLRISARTGYYGDTTP